MFVVSKTIQYQMQRISSWVHFLYYQSLLVFFFSVGVDEIDPSHSHSHSHNQHVPKSFTYNKIGKHIKKLLILLKVCGKSTIREQITNHEREDIVEEARFSLM